MEFLLLLTAFPAYLVASFFIKNDPGPAEPKHGIHTAVWFGVTSIVLALALSALFSFLISGDLIGSITGEADESSMPLAINVLIFASVEELVKFVPIAIYLIKRDFFNEVTDGIIYFAIVGLTFGAIESFLYAATSGSIAMSVALVRLAMSLFFHGALTAIVGFHFAKAKVTNTSASQAMIALVIVSFVHAAYNYFVFESSAQPTYIFAAAAIAIATNATMFWLYFAAAKKDFELGIAPAKNVPSQTPQAPVAVPPQQGSTGMPLPNLPPAPQPYHPAPEVQPAQPAADQPQTHDSNPIPPQPPTTV